MPQQVLMRPLGIITQPNKLGQYPAGALKVATNALMRSPGLIEAAKLPAQFIGSLPGVTSTVFCQAFDDLLMFFTTGATWAAVQWMDISSLSFTVQNFTPDGITALSFPNDGRFSMFSMRDRTFIATTQGVFAFDTSAGAPPTSSTVRMAGMRVPRLTFSVVSTHNTTADGTLPANTACHTVAVLRRRYADGYELVSPPSAAAMCVNLNANGADLLKHTVSLLGFMAEPGDVIEIYRTRSQAVTTVNPYSGTNTGNTYLLSATLTLGASVVGSFDIFDRVPDAQLGQALYTNPGIGGGASSAIAPPGCRAACTFRGHAFYMHRVDPPSVTLRVPVWWGNMNFGTLSGPYIRTRGIGNRAVTGNVTSGSPTITAISAVDIAGVVKGQVTFTGFFPGGATVVSVGVSTVTMSVNSSTTATGVGISFQDVIEINGTSFSASDLTELVYQTSGYGSFVIRCLDRIYPSILTNTIGSTPTTVPAEGFVIQGEKPWEATTSLTIRATNGANYSPALPSIELDEAPRAYAGVTVMNGISWSEENQPENVPPSNTATVGSGEIYAAVSTRDAVWIFASDGLWRLSGTGGNAGAGYDWRRDPVDKTLSLSGPWCAAVHKDIVYAYTSRGLVSIDSAGNIREITQERLADQLPGPTWQQRAATYDTTSAMFVVADETNDEIILRVPGMAGGAVWVYNVNTDAFTQYLAPSATYGEISHACYSPKYENVAFFTKKPGNVLFAYTPSASTRASMTLEFQPIYSENPFWLRHWQRIDWSFAGLSAGVQLTCTPNAQASLAQTRTIPAAGVDGDSSRTSFDVPRNSPAIANQLVVGCSTASTAQPVQLQGVAVVFTDFTDERRDR